MEILFTYEIFLYKDFMMDFSKTYENPHHRVRPFGTRYITLLARKLCKREFHYRCKDFHLYPVPFNTTKELHTRYNKVEVRRYWKTQQEWIVTQIGRRARRSTPHSTIISREVQSGPKDAQTSIIRSDSSNSLFMRRGNPPSPRVQIQTLKFTKAINWNNL